LRAGAWICGAMAGRRGMSSSMSCCGRCRSSGSRLKPCCARMRECRGPRMDASDVQPNQKKRWLARCRSGFSPTIRAEKKFSRGDRRARQEEPEIHIQCVLFRVAVVEPRTASGLRNWRARSVASRYKEVCNSRSRAEPSINVARTWTAREPRAIIRSNNAGW
jgi:hypothetical protein